MEKPQCDPLRIVVLVMVQYCYGLTALSNLYTCVYNNPSMYSEPSGHSPIDKGVQAYSEKAADIVADIAVGDSVSIEQAIKEYVRDVYIKMTETDGCAQRRRIFEDTEMIRIME